MRCSSLGVALRTAQQSICLRQLKIPYPYLQKIFSEVTPTRSLSDCSAKAFIRNERSEIPAWKWQESSYTPSRSNNIATGGNCVYSEPEKPANAVCKNCSHKSRGLFVALGLRRNNMRNGCNGCVCVMKLIHDKYTNPYYLYTTISTNRQI